MKLDKNQYQCPRCKDILTSEHNYDFKRCSCGAVAIDGGANQRIIEFEMLDEQQKEKDAGSVNAEPGEAGKP